MSGRAYRLRGSGGHIALRDTFHGVCSNGSAIPFILFLLFRLFSGLDRQLLKYPKEIRTNCSSQLRGAGAVSHDLLSVVSFESENGGDGKVGHSQAGCLL